MADKVQKIREEVARIQLYTQSEVLKQILDYIDSMQEDPIKIDRQVSKIADEFAEREYETDGYERQWLSKGYYHGYMDANKDKLKEPVSEELWEAAQIYYEELQKEKFEGSDVIDAFKAGAQWQKEKDSILPMELGEFNELSKQFPEVSFAKLSRIAVRVAKWQREHLWKSADGDDLPEIDREVVAFQEAFPTDVDVPRLFKIVMAHRPNPDGWDGKSIATGEIKHYTPKTYDKGGWNIPDIVYWLDVELPKEIEL